MSRLYDIIRQMEENSQTANISQQEIFLLDSGRSGTKKWWQSYRVVILIFVVTLAAAISLTLGTRIISYKTQKPLTAPIHSISSSSESTQNRDSKETTTLELAVVSENNKKLEQVTTETKSGEKESGDVRIQEAVENKSRTDKKDENTTEKPPAFKATNNKKISSKDRQASKAKSTVKKEPTTKLESEKQTSGSVKNEKRPTWGSLPVQSGMITMAEEARRKGNIEEAIQLYKQYILLHRHPMAMNNLGALLISKGQLNEAEELLREAFQMTPDEDIAVNLIGVEMMLGKLDQACNVLRQIKKTGTEISPSLRTFELRFNVCNE